jgi:predicted nucleotide-binding protein
MTQIRNSHFGIADITGSNPNVMLEIGMMMMLGRRVLLLRRKGEEGQLPFDLQPFLHHEYELRENGELWTWHTSDKRFAPIAHTLPYFIEDLQRDPEFLAARDWIE